MSKSRGKAIGGMLALLLIFFGFAPAQTWGGLWGSLNLSSLWGGAELPDPSMAEAPDPPSLSNPVLGDDGFSDEWIVEESYGNSFLAYFADGQNGADGTPYKNPKKLLYLEGGAYERGYAEGYLCPEGTYRMTHDFVYGFLNSFVEGLVGPASPDLSLLLPVVRKVLIQAVRSQEYAVPEEYLQEMRGIADGAQAKGYDVRYDDLLLLNVGFDFLYGVVYQAASLLCNEFALFGNSTTNGHLFHGRDFMFTTGGDVFSDMALVMIHKIPRYKGYSFVASAAPGFVGFPTGMNEYGVSFGMDMVANRQNRPLVSGMGCLLLCRHVLQNAKTLEQAIDRVESASRGTSWLFMIADGKANWNERPNDAVVLETVADRMIPEGGDLLSTVLGISPVLENTVNELNGASPLDLKTRVEDLVTDLGGGVLDLLEQLPLIGDLHPDNGVAIRTADYEDPEGIENWQLVLPLPDLLLLGKTDHDDVEYNAGQTVVRFFPMQQESYPDAIAMTNHYILPQMNYTQMGLFYHTVDTLQGGGRESEYRYNTLIELISRYRDHNMIDRVTAMWLIDLLNPARSSFYGKDEVTQSVKGHHILMDNNTLEMWSLHGYYNEPWVHVNLRDFLDP